MQCGHVQSAWEGPLIEGERAPLGEEGAPAGGGGREEEPRGGLPDLQSLPVYRSQMLLQSALGDLNSPAIYKGVADLGTRKTSTACCLADALAMP